MDSHSSSVRFSETPPGSPKSCMKGSRRINFAPEPGDDGPSSESSNPSPSTSSPKRSGRSVMIKAPGTGGGGVSDDAASKEGPGSSSQKRPTDIQFQFHLSQHYEQSTPPPNCTSNGSYEDQRLKDAESQQEDDPRNDPQLMEIASKFVNEIIETAKVEAARRQKAAEEQERTRASTAASTAASTLRAVAEEFLGGTGGNPWYRRAHGAISKWITNLCVRAQNTIRT